MAKKEKKLAVLHCLCEEADSISLPQLLEKMGAGYEERSVRRWLAEMIEEGLIEKTGARKGTRYKIVGKTDRAGSNKGCFSNDSLKVIERIRKPLFERTPVSYSVEWLDAYKPNSSFYVPYSLRMKLQKAGQRARKEDPAGTYAHQIFNRLLIDLSYNSSRLEGNTYSLLDTEKLLLEGRSAEGKLDEEKIMILNHKEAIRFLVDQAPRLMVSEETIFTLHFLLSEGLLELRESGKIRRYSVRIGGSSYIPFEDFNQLQLNFKQIIAKATRIEDPFEQSFFLLAHVSYIQAFADVNKRTARLSANISLIKGNLVPLSFNDVDRDDYNSSLLAIYEFQDTRPLLDLFAFSYLRTCAMYDSTIRSLGFDEIRVRYRAQRRSVIREIILGKLTGEKMRSFITQKAMELIPEHERRSFVEDALEDLAEIDNTRLFGLGVSPDELREWQSI